MGKKTGGNKNTGRKLWGFLGALWLVAACLAGCGVPGNDGGSQAEGEKAVQASGWETKALESETQVSQNGGEDREAVAEQGAESGREEGDAQNTGTDGEPAQAPDIEESGIYTSKDQVALYLHIYGRLPQNYITKRDAQDLGWDSKKGNLWDVAPGMSIGGSRFGNYEGALPEKEGRKYFECDIDYEGGYRGGKRLVYSDDGLIFYTEDHYNTFEQLYGQ